MNSELKFSTNNRELSEGFAWAKAQALAYAVTGDPVGDWYEAALPGRAAFCMRDVSHQAAGAHLLGLARFNRNMLHRFASAIAAERDWCSFWEIDKHGRPCPVDYRDDGYFWYNFPANFDVLDCCFRQYLWTGDRAYLDDPAYRFFYAKTVKEYVQRWDRDGDGLLEHYPEYGFRGIATYDEQVPDPLTGADLLAAQYAGYLAYAHFLELEERGAEAGAFREKAADLQRLFEEQWWNAQESSYDGFIEQDHTFAVDRLGQAALFALYFGLIGRPERQSLVLDELARAEAGLGVEGRSYVPEIFYRYGGDEAAYRVLLALFDPGLPRREYPEVSYALVGAVGTGLMGLRADARERLVTSLPHLTEATGWAEMENVPLFEAQIAVRHTGRRETRLAVQRGRPLFWRAAFPGEYDVLEVDGRAWPALHHMNASGQKESSVLIRVQRGEEHTVRAKE